MRQLLCWNLECCEWRSSEPLKNKECESLAIFIMDIGKKNSWENATYPNYAVTLSLKFEQSRKL